MRGQSHDERDANRFTLWTVEARLAADIVRSHIRVVNN